jgi:hypothetical protein
MKYHNDEWEINRKHELWHIFIKASKVNMPTPFKEPYEDNNPDRSKRQTKRLISSKIYKKGINCIWNKNEWLEDDILKSRWYISYIFANQIILHVDHIDYIYNKGT